MQLMMLGELWGMGSAEGKRPTSGEGTVGAQGQATDRAGQVRRRERVVPRCR